MLATSPAAAHQPYFEDQELTADAPYQIDDISISLAFYGSLDSAGDVDYFVFAGKAGQQVYLRMVIPTIEGQEAFTPTLALMGAGLDPIRVPKPVVQPVDNGAILLRATPGKPSIFFEPFGGRNYYERQEATITLPNDGHYIVAIWSESGQIGRYTFSPGKREVFGGDRNYFTKFLTYWSALPTPEPTEIFKPRGSVTDHSCGD
ncbi:MAG: hypothetical protein U0175_01950 [Caldilineaceae bacterium]